MDSGLSFELGFVGSILVDEEDTFSPIYYWEHFLFVCTSVEINKQFDRTQLRD